MDEIWIHHDSARPWDDAVAWDEYLQRASEILGGPVTHLDENDPIRRTAEPGGMGRFITTFREREENRWLFGRLRSVKCEFAIRLQRGATASHDSLKWSIPAGHVASKGPAPLVELFELGVRAWKPFYSFADDREAIAARRRSTGSIDLQRQLIGAFWLTSFGPEYVEFFGADRVRALPSVRMESDGAAVFRLAGSPEECQESQRKALEAALGASSFVDPRDEQIKPPGRFALTWKQLASRSPG